MDKLLNKIKTMKSITSLIIAILYLIAVIITLSLLSYKFFLAVENKVSGSNLLLACILIAGFGGSLYCLRGVYLNFCVKNQWSTQWLPWYIIRPIVSMICGGVSYTFLKAGLLILEAKNEPDSTNLGFYALAFIAGMNVDKFISKIEDLAQAAWGIEKSRTSKSEN